MTFTEAPLSVNFKPSTAYDAPMLTIRGGDPNELGQRVTGAQQSGVVDTISNADRACKTAYGPSPGAQNVQNIMGGQVLETQPAPAPAPAPAAPANDGWATTPAPAWGAQPQAPAAAPAPAYQPQAQAPAGSNGAPFIPAFNQNATFRSGNGARGPWSAYLDPRPKQVTDALPVDHTGKVPSTEDPNHPGLAAGTHKFAKFLR